MNYQIADAHTSFFDDKQHYLNFRQAWKNAAQRSAKKGDDWGCLTGSHMFFYAAVRGRNVYDAFTPIHTKTKLENGFHINQGMYFAYEYLDRLTKWQGSSWQEERLDEFLKPFNGTIDKERFVKIVESFPAVTPLFSNYGKGTLAVEALLSPATYRLSSTPTPRVLWNVVEKAMETKEAA